MIDPTDQCMEYICDVSLLQGTTRLHEAREHRGGDSE